MISLPSKTVRKIFFTNYFIGFLVFFISLLISLNSADELRAEEANPLDYAQCQYVGGSWRGYIDLNEYGAQQVIATIIQSGCYITIKTSSTLSYGQDFSGEITQGNYLTVIEQNTGETWTTHFARAEFSSIGLYDYVHDFHDYDKLILAREPPPQ